MRIVHLMTTLNQGGIGSFVEGLTRLFGAEDVESEFILTRGLGGRPVGLASGEFPIHYCPELYTTYDPGLPHRISRLLRQSAVLGYGARLAVLMRRLAPDVIHSHCHYTHWLSQILAARCSNAPFIMSLHASDSKYPGYWRARHLLPPLIRTNDRFIVPSNGVREAYQPFLKRLKSKNVISLPYGIHVPDPPSSARRSEARARLSIPADAFVVGSVGRLIAPKRYTDMVDALRLLRGRGRDNVYFVLVGSGNEKDLIEARVKVLDLTDRVRILGFQPDQHEWLNMFDLYVLVSLHEGFPIGIIEAMAHGVPIVGTDVSGIRDALAGERTGLLVPPMKPGAIADAIGRIIDDPERARVMGDAARAQFHENYEFSSVAAQYMELYRLVSRRRTPGGETLAHR